MKTKTMAMFALLMIALSVAGFAYATWKDTVVISGKVKMGEFIVGILNNSVEVTETTNGVPEDEFKVPKPWVANTTVTLEDFEKSKHHVPTETVAKTMIVNITNAYPCYDVEINFTLKNAGTIPANITSVTITEIPAIAAEFTFTPPLLYKQIDPCTKIEATLTIHFLQTAEECHTYTFKIEIVAVQWNKA